MELAKNVSLRLRDPGRAFLKKQTNSVSRPMDAKNEAESHIVRFRIIQ